MFFPFPATIASSFLYALIAPPWIIATAQARVAAHKAQR